MEVDDEEKFIEIYLLLTLTIFFFLREKIVFELT